MTMPNGLQIAPNGAATPRRVVLVGYPGGPGAGSHRPARGVLDVQQAGRGEGL